MIFKDDVLPIAFGCDPLGGHNWGKVDPDAIMACIPEAIDGGMTIFDTADCYGNGLSELRLGEALGKRRKEAIIASKFGVRLGADNKPFIDNNPKWIAAAIDGSLHRLRTDYLDLYQLHWWDKVTPFDDIFDALQRLVEAGKIRAFGSTNLTLEMMGLTSPDQLPSGYVSSSMEFSLVHTDNRKAIEQMCGNEGSPAFLAWGSLGGGILSGKYRSEADFDAADRRLRRADSHFTGPRLEKNLRIVKLCREIANAQGAGVTIAQVALQWISKTLGFGIALVGIKGQQQLDEALASHSFSLSEDDVQRLDIAAGQPC